MLLPLLYSSVYRFLLRCNENGFEYWYYIHCTFSNDVRIKAMSLRPYHLVLFEKVQLGYSVVKMVHPFKRNNPIERSV